MFTRILLAALLTHFGSCAAAFSQQPSTPSNGILVLDDCDSDYRNPPFEDAAILFGANGKPFRKQAEFNLCATVGGCRALSIAPNGGTFVVCENVGNKITAYQTDSGKSIWSLNGRFTAATVSPSGLIYALTSQGTIYGDQISVIDGRGQIVKQEKLGGFDLALDPGRGVLWVVGNKIRKCDLDLKLLIELDYISWCAVSIDVDQEHSVWIAERQHSNIGQSTNRILKVSPNGRLQRAVGLKWSPFCLRVNRTDGSVWVTGVEVQPSTSQRLFESLEKRTGRLQVGKSVRDFLTKPRVLPKTHHYDAAGILLHEIDQGGHSLDLDLKDGSVWIASQDRIYHYSSKGERLARFSGVSSEQKYIVVVPGRSKDKAAGD